MTLCVLPVCLLAWLSRLFFVVSPPPPEALPWSCAPSAAICQIICCLCPLLDDVCTMCSVQNFPKQIMCSSLLLLILSLPMWVYQLPVYFYMMSLLCNLFMLLLSVKFTTSVVFASASPICWKPVKCLCMMYVSVLQRHFQTSASYEFEWKFVLNK